MPFASFDPARALGVLAPQDIGVCTGEATRVLSANEAFERISGCTRDAILHGAVDAARLLPTEWQDEADTAALFTHRHGFSRPYLRQLHRPDGTQIDVIVVGAIAATAPLRWVCCVVDVSTLAQDLGAAARTSLGLPPRERRGHDAVPRLVDESPVSTTGMPAVRPMLAAVLDAAPTGALLLNDNAEAVHATPAACTMLGHAASQFAGSRWRDLLHPADLAQLDGRLLLLLGGVRADAAPSMPLRWRHANGFWLMLDVQPVLVPDAADCLTVLHLHDRTPIHEAERRAEQAEAVRQAVIAGMPGHAAVEFDLGLQCIRAEGDGVAALCAAAGAADVAHLGRTWVMRLAPVRDGYDDAWTVEGPEMARVHCTGTALRDSRGIMTGVLLTARTSDLPRHD